MERSLFIRFIDFFVNKYNYQFYIFFVFCNIQTKKYLHSLSIYYYSEGIRFAPLISPPMRKNPFFLVSLILALFIGSRFYIAYSQQSTFRDVPTNHSYADAIEYLYSQSMVNGYADGNFRPDATINRAEFLKIITEAVFVSEDIEQCETNLHKLADVSQDQWYTAYVCIGVKEGIIAGYEDGTFRPANTINFAEAAKIISNSFGYDASEDAVWFRPFVDNLGRKSAIPLSIEQFDQAISRGQMAEMIYRLHANVQNKASHSLASLEKEIHDGSHDEEPSNVTVPGLVQTDSIQITIEGEKRVIRGNGLPNHETGDFPNSHNPNAIAEQSYEFEMPLYPEIADTITPLGLHDFGIALNGIPFDPGAAEFYNNDRNSGWQYEALSGAVNLGLDQHNAHVQPTGAYHYHGTPTALIDGIATDEHSKLIGFAGDGFPIYWKYGYENANDVNSEVVEMKSSYHLKDGVRSSGPGGKYDGTFVQDYTYTAGFGNLDECNGRETITPDYPQGTYAYFITDDFPFIPRCFKGTLDESFLRGPAGQGQQPGGGPNGNRPPPGQGGFPRAPGSGLPADF